VRAGRPQQIAVQALTRTEHLSGRAVVILSQTIETFGQVVARDKDQSDRH
jgi:hypothetical protein